MNKKTKLVELHLINVNTKIKTVRVKEVNYNTYCKLKKAVEDGYYFNEFNNGFKNNFKVESLKNI